MSATLTIVPAPEIGDNVRCVTIDCDHGTTTVHQFDTARVHVPDPALVCLALLEHDRSEGCGCTQPLWRRYGQAVAQ